jgi:secreted trypsin-like serine protease
MKKINTLLITLLFLRSSFILANNDFISTRVVGGQQSEESDWPWMVSISSEISNQYIYTCAGTLINNSTVLTAAHCLFDEDGAYIANANITVSVGEYNKNSRPLTATSNVIKKDIHENYDPSNVASGDDIALLHLETPVFNITPVKLLDVDSLLKAIDQQSNVTTIGWGSTNAYEPEEIVTPTYPTILNDVILPLQTDEMCSKNLGNSYNSSKMICAAPEKGGEGACQGDSGGPLVFNDQGTWKQLGIVSWGAGCASAGHPDVYTRISNYTDWIDLRLSALLINNQLTFPYIQANSNSTQALLISNNTEEEAQLSFAISGSNRFTYEVGSCDVIAPKTTCSLNITYTSTTAEVSLATLTVETNLPTSTDFSTLLNATTIADISDIANQANFPNSNSQWFTGGDAPWNILTNSEILQSQKINHSQESVLIATFTSNGRLAFDWAVNSELGYDLLDVNINGQLIDSISGSTDYKTQSYFLGKALNTVIWRYKKDETITRGTDLASIRKVTFETMTQAEFNPPTNSNGGGGGSLFFIFSIPFLLIRRYYTK